jgi:hypothetical protein
MMSVGQSVEWLAGETCPSATLPTTNPTSSELGQRGGKPVTNVLTYGMACVVYDRIGFN